MKRFLKLALCAAMPLVAMDLKVDHVTVAGRDLAAMQKAFGEAGLVAEYGGKHTNGMTEMAIVSFPDGSYLELIAAQPGASAAKHDWGAYIEGDAGVCAWAVSTGDLGAAVRRMAETGLDVTPTTSGRQRPDGKALAWRMAAPGPAPRGSYFPFLIEDQTPRELRAYPRGAASVQAMDGIALVVVGVRDLESAVHKWRATFGLKAAQHQHDEALGARLAWFPDSPVILAEPDGPRSALTRRLDQFGEAPFAVVLRAREGTVAAPASRVMWFGRQIDWLGRGRVMGTRIGVTSSR